jgi:uncharacterized protein
MDAFHVYQGQRFAWDLTKAEANLKKHGISFETACEVFFDPFVHLMHALEESESREAAVGFTEDSMLLFVVHLIRETEDIRIISARAATARERRDYENS